MQTPVFTPESRICDAALCYLLHPTQVDLSPVSVRTVDLVLQSFMPANSSLLITDGTHTIRLPLAGQPKVYGGAYPQPGEWWTLIIRQQQIVCGRLVPHPAYIPWHIGQIMLQLSTHRSLFDPLIVTTALLSKRDVPAGDPADSPSASTLPPPPAGAAGQQAGTPAAPGYTLDGAMKAILGVLNEPKEGQEVKNYCCQMLQVNEVIYGAAMGHLIASDRVITDGTKIAKKF